MSLYECSCGEPTIVIDTRQVYGRSKRRRKCPKNHRFNTVEVPTNINLKLFKLIEWGTEQDINDEDIKSYLLDQIDNILLGRSDEED